MESIFDFHGYEIFVRIKELNKILVINMTQIQPVFHEWLVIFYIYYITCVSIIYIFLTLVPGEQFIGLDIVGNLTFEKYVGHCYFISGSAFADLSICHIDWNTRTNFYCAVHF